ncbi:EcsC family protein [Bacillus kwashiorkori]|uniref:EcsC family protein n=1 Tax=Bacillus kwashiorkori TaxID=1522318 RepID=UPI000785AF04|nr:EcsC family protein [Bacillus kwashiorkori]
MGRETIEWLQEELHKVKKWEQDQSDLWFWEKLGRIPFKILDKWTPKFIHEKVGVLLDEMGNYIQTGGSYLSSIEKLNDYYPGKQFSGLEDVFDLYIVEMDKAAENIAKGRKKLATFQGASTGFGGIFTLTIDIPLLLGLQLKTLQDIAICYGYNPNEKSERIFIVKVLQFVSSDYVGKQTILSQLTHYNMPVGEEKREVVSEIQGWREVFFTYRDQFGWKKLFQMIPVAGLIFGAFTNRSAINDIAEAGQMLYRKRRIIERLTAGDSPPPL